MVYLQVVLILKAKNDPNAVDGDIVKGIIYIPMCYVTFVTFPRRSAKSNLCN